jgi:hypothetical protein
MSPSIEDLHPAQNRQLRELYAATRHVVNHYRALAQKLDIGALHDGAATARRLLDDLTRITERYDLYGFPAAQGVGANAARFRSGVGERFLERNQALRFAVVDVQHVVTLLGYLAAVSEVNGNQDLVDFCHSWEATMLEVEQRVRAAAVDIGRSPDYAIEPLHPTAVGRAAHGFAQGLVGGFGEWFDRKSGHRRG